ncbi:MAG: hypothetical protein KAS30_01590 [Candidatus Diapherotrites archaeon]|nr:hypothetical protein [Candidatus Diapherotrites archaeon]
MIKAQPIKVEGNKSMNCLPHEATHVELNFPTEFSYVRLPVILGNKTRDKTLCWSWNGDVTKPTFKPSILTTCSKYRCHSFVTDGKIKFLSDCSHEFAGQTVELLDIE